MQAATCSEHRAGLDTSSRKPTRRQSGEGRRPAGSERHSHRRIPPGYLVVACMYEGDTRTFFRNTLQLCQKPVARETPRKRTVF